MNLKLNARKSVILMWSRTMLTTCFSSSHQNVLFFLCKLQAVNFTKFTRIKLLRNFENALHLGIFFLLSTVSFESNDNIKFAVLKTRLCVEWTYSKPLLVVTIVYNLVSWVLKKIFSLKMVKHLACFGGLSKREVLSFSKSFPQCPKQEALDRKKGLLLQLIWWENV